MIKLSRRGCALLLALATLLNSGQVNSGPVNKGQAFATPASPTDSTTLVLERLLELTQVPAFSVAVVRNGDVLMQSTVGEVDVRNHFKAHPEHRFRLASVSKVIGATMLALLVQKGDLDPNAPLDHYLDNLPQQYRDLTVLQLLAHVSGLPHYQAVDALIATTHYDSAIDTLASVGSRELVASPGTSYIYSTHGYTLLGALYESITGVPLTRSVPAFVAQFSGRDTPELENLQQRQSQRSNVFEIESDGARTLKPRDQSYSPFGTGFIATATDLAQFGDAVLHSPLLHTATRDLLFRPIALDGGDMAGTYLYEVAFGWRVGKDSSGRTVYHHAGVTEGARSVLVLYPHFGLSIAFLSNASWTAQIERTAFALANTILEEQTPFASGDEHVFTGSFDGHALAGTLSCKLPNTICRFDDNQGKLSEWLGRYYHDELPAAGWPTQLLAGRHGVVIKLLTPVGIVELHQDSDENVFTSEIGNGRKLVVRFGKTLVVPVSTVDFDSPSHQN